MVKASDNANGFKKIYQGPSRVECGTLCWNVHEFECPNMPL